MSWPFGTPQRPATSPRSLLGSTGRSSREHNTPVQPSTKSGRQPVEKVARRPQDQVTQPARASGSVRPRWLPGSACGDNLPFWLWAGPMPSLAPRYFVRNRRRMAVSTDATPARWPVGRLLLAGLLVVLAVWINFGPFHRGQNADSLIPVLASLDEWTLYFWGQDRFGMPVSLLAVPFRDPTVNLLVQSAVTIFCGLSAFF